MKTFLSALSLVFLSLVLQAQTPTGFWYLGPNSGMSWQSSDVKSRMGFGWGLTLDKILTKSPDRYVGWALRGRYLRARNWGQDITPTVGIVNNPAVNGTYDPNANYVSNPGYTYLNHSTKTNEFALEMRLFWNRWWHKAHVSPYFFAGVGASGFKVNTDVLDAFGNTYDYTSIDPNGLFVKNDILTLRDKDFETRAEHTSYPTWTPVGNLGAGFAVRMGYGAQLGWEYKLALTGSDLMDGNRYKTTNALTDENDAYHYFNMWLSFKLYGNGQARVRNAYPPQTYGQTEYKPVITISRNETSTDCQTLIEANIRNLGQSGSLVVEVQGLPIPTDWYSFNPVTGAFRMLRNLQVYPATISFNASNSVGTARQSIQVDCPRMLPPIIIPVQPNGIEVVLNDCNTSVVLAIQNISGLSQVNASLNDVPVSQSSMSWNAATNQLTISLIVPRNARLKVSAFNETGRAEFSYQLICSGAITPIANPPVVTILQPQSGAILSNCNTYEVQAIITEVSTKDQIQVYVNNQLYNPANYQWIQSTRMLKVPIFPTSNGVLVRIEANSTGGFDSKSINFSCRPQVVQPYPPQIIRVYPISSPYTSYNCPENLQFKIMHIQTAAQIRVLRNNVPMPAGSYNWNPQTQLLSFSSIAQGDQQIQVVATNNDGSVSENLILNCRLPEVPVPLPIVNITSPTSETHSSVTCQETLFARLNYVTSSADIVVYQNNVPLAPSAYAFNSTTGILEMKVEVKAETNIRIVGRNARGQAEDRITLVCTKPAPTLIVCVPGTNGAARQTKTIKLSEWETYKSQGAVEGACPSEVKWVDICIGGQNIRVEETQVSQYLSQGATVGACPIVERNIRLCMMQEGKPTTIVVPENKAEEYISKGARLGTCEEQPIVNMCLNNQNVQVMDIEKSAYLSKGASVGTCPIIEKVFQLCVSENGSSKSVEVKESQLQSYLDKGATIGSCESQAKLDICLNGISKSILSQEWSYWQAQGAKSGTCPPPEKDVTLCTLANGVATSITVKESQVNTYLSQGALLGSCETAPKTTICFNSTNQTVLELEQTEWIKKGATAGPCPTPVKTIEICLNQEIKLIPENELSVWMAKGATAGACPIIEKEVDLCILQNGQATTRKVKESELNTYLAQGARLGTCNSLPKETVCYKDSSQQILQLEWPEYQRIGAIAGPCPEKIIEIEICMVVNGKATSQTIPEKELNAYLQKGAKVGSCKEYGQINVCQNNETKSIHELEWSYWQAQGATKGSCPIPEKTISICRVNNGITENITVKESELSAYLSQGAALGSCESQPKTTICFEGKTTEILSFQLESYTSKGAKVGICIDKPTILVLAPGTSPYISESCQEKPSFRITGVSEKTQLAVTINGSPLNANAFAFNAESGILEFNHQVIQKSTIVVKATNSAGLASASLEITCKPKTGEVPDPFEGQCGTRRAPFTDCATCTENFSGSTTIDVQEGQKYCISGSWSGNLNMNGGQLVICGSAVVNQLNFNDGEIVVNGSIRFNQVNLNKGKIKLFGSMFAQSLVLGGLLENNGTIEINGEVNVNSGGRLINNGTFKSNASLNLNAAMCNSGLLHTDVDLKLNSGSSFDNKCKVEVMGDFHVNSTLSHEGYIKVAKTAYFNAGSIQFTAGAWLQTQHFNANVGLTVSGNSTALLQASGNSVLNSSAKFNGAFALCDDNGVETNNASFLGGAAITCSNGIASTSCAPAFIARAVKMVTICHYSTQDRKNPQTIQVPENEVNSYLAKGDALGVCPVAPVVLPPTVTITTPSVTPYNAPQCSTQVIAVVQNIEVKSQITVRVNGESTTNFSFVNGNVSLNVVAGTNSRISISATNESGTASDEVIISCSQKLDFDIETGTVVPNKQYCAEVKVVGCALKVGGNGADLPIMVRVQLGAQIVDPFGSYASFNTAANVNDGKTHTWRSPSNIAANTPISITAKSFMPGKTTTLFERNSKTDQVMVKVLRNNDPVPSLQGFNGQSDAKSYINQFIANNKIKLNENQAIYLFELGTSTATSSAYDLQDCVILVTLSEQCTFSGSTEPVPYRSETTPIIEEKKIAICHYPPGNTGNPQQIEIAESAWPAHQAHGDVMGTCPVIEEKKIAICHYPPGNTGNPQQIEIAESAWPAHQAHGDVMGTCPVQNSTQEDLDKEKKAQEELERQQQQREQEKREQEQREQEQRDEELKERMKQEQLRKAKEQLERILPKLE